jgi:hypothetical protein
MELAQKVAFSQVLAAYVVQAVFSMHAVLL